MRIRHLSLTNYRNFGRLELDLPNGTTLIYGDNAQGKTNLLEAIYYLATTRSPNTSQDSQLINWDAGQLGETILVGRIVAHVETQDGLRHLEMRLIEERERHSTGFRREALVDRRKVRLMDLLGNLRVVLFLPQDLNLVTGSPSMRRRYLDITLCQSDAVYCRTLSQYNKVLEQRNALLRKLSEEGRRQTTDVLDLFTDRLANLGGKIFLRRAQFLGQLAREVQRIHYEALTDGRETLRLTYLPRLLPRQDGRDATEEEMQEAGLWIAAQTDQAAVSTRYRELLQQAVGYDLRRGATTIGPHRDDWRFFVNERNLAHFGSRGQQRSAVLALKLGEIAWVSAETRDTPILLLDDVMAELDPQRRDLLIAALDGVGQAFVTSADVAIFPDDFLDKINLLPVKKGRIVPQGS